MVEIIRNLKNLWYFLNKKLKKKFAVLVLIATIGAILEIINISLLYPFLSLISNDENFVLKHKIPLLETFISNVNSGMLIAIFGGVFVATTIILCIFRLIIINMEAKLAFNVGEYLGYKMYENMLHIPYEYSIKKNSSEIIYTLANKTDGIVYTIVIPILNIIVALFNATFLLVLLLYVNTIATLLAFIVIGGLYYSILLFSKNNIQKSGILMNNERNKLIKNVQEGAGSIRDIIINGIQQKFLEKYRVSDHILRSKGAYVYLLSSMPRYVIESGAMLLIAVLAILFSQNNSENKIIPMLGVLALSAQRLLPSLQTIYSALTGIINSQSILDDVISILNENNKIKKSKIDIKFNTNILFKNVGYSYSKLDNDWIFRGINLEIKKGDKLAVVGKTGSGKSTFVDILMGLITPTEGQITVDNISLTDETLDSWYKIVSHVPQRIFIEDSNIIENIIFNCVDININQARLNESIKISQLTDFIEKEPEGLQRKVGESGVLISGGQAQRIGIARALYKNSKLLVMDEATNALDADTEYKLLDRLLAIPNLTIILITHNRKILNKFNKIISLENGSLKIIKND